MSHSHGKLRRVDYGHATRPDLPCQHQSVHRMTCDEYEALRDRAQDACEICRTPGPQTPRGSLVIDHFEGGGVRFVRGLLCDRCNSVMTRHDRSNAWGPASLPFAEKSAAYHRAAWARPAAEEFEIAARVIAARTPWSRQGNR